MKHIDHLMTRLHDSAGQPRDVAKWYAYLTLDSIGELVFGESFDCLETDEEHVCSPIFAVSLLRVCCDVLTSL